MNTRNITVKESNLIKHILENFEEGALVEISYNRVFIPGKIICIDDDATLTVQLLGQLLNQRVDINIDEIKSELVEIIYTFGGESTVITVIN